MHRPPPGVWVDPRVEVRPSAIEGQGLFAAEPIDAGEVVVELGGRIVDQAELDRLIAEGTDYVDSVTIDVDQHLVLPAGSIAHFGNHSCDPNLRVDRPYRLVAGRAVARAEELTVDYGTISGADGFSMVCRCGAATCRGVVTNDRWRPLA
ncbi:MAG: SET domain-containing protein-lysine N-methyltransferase [Acidimicrobiia bacterium]|nr:SET domain-containing protein-lysine N-methyltransferase [Acidimicrobiia bacterium]